MHTKPFSFLIPTKYTKLVSLPFLSMTVFVVGILDNIIIWNLLF